MHLRPGPILGAYPERDSQRIGLLEEWLDRAGGLWRRVWPHRVERFSPIVRRVNDQAVAVRELSAQALDSAILEVRRRLWREGLTDAAAIRAFALIREQADRVLGLRPYDVQILGGWVMLQGMIAEMQTGEGKTLTATLPAATAAMAGIPVHLITVNDYLVARDAAQMQPLYHALGLTVGRILEGMDPDERRAAYACDIVYCTNKQLVFDYLRDSLQRGRIKGVRMRLDGLFGEQSVHDRLLLRGLCFGILDEADSILIDEARTPLIISRPVAEADDLEAVYRLALDLAAQLEPVRDYRLDPKRREVELTATGGQRLARLIGNMPETGSVWKSNRRREELVRQAIHARELLIREKHYLVKDGKVCIIDLYTGRLMPDRSWERGIHQLVEVKEGCDVTVPVETLAKISFQHFFRRYRHLAGMTGTAREVAGELWSIYHLDVVGIPPHRPLHRRAIAGQVHATLEDKWNAVLACLRRLHGQGIPVLVGTASVEASEQLSALLSRAGIEHQVLNARQDHREAEIIARAGQLGQVTVATNMAGRGTDIKLGPGVEALGGLHVIATERHEARRIDRQLYGRSGRQGDPGAYQYIVSLQDDLVIRQGWDRSAQWVARFRDPDDSTIPFGPSIIYFSQRSAERRYARIRRQLLKFDEHTNQLLAFSGRLE